MKLLFDTQVFIWWDSESDKLPKRVLQLCEDDNRLEILPVEATHIFGLQALPAHHKDPFDRLLIAQAITEGMPILSVDAMFKQYPIQVFAA